MERLILGRAIALEHALDTSTHASYSSALNSYLAFCQIHHFPLDPTPDTLSLYVVFQSHHIEPRSVDSYLSGICSELEPFYPAARANRRSSLVARTLKGCKRLYSKPVQRKRALTREDLNLVSSSLAHTDSYDDHLFLTLLLTGFHALLRLGELVWPDQLDRRSYRKLSRRTSVKVTNVSFQFALHSHKTDRQFAGDIVLVHKTISGANPFLAFRAYLAARNLRHPCRSELWLKFDGAVPTRGWFTRRLRRFFPSDVSGHSMRAGGATALALEGVPHASIQAIGRWSSDAWRIYIRQHPVVVQATMFNQQHPPSDPAPSSA